MPRAILLFFSRRSSPQLDVTGWCDFEEEDVEWEREIVFLITLHWQESPDVHLKLERST